MGGKEKRKRESQKKKMDKKRTILNTPVNKTHLRPLRFVAPIHGRVSVRRVLVIGDDSQGRTRPRRVKEIPLAASKHQHEVFSVIKVAFRDNAPTSESALNSLLPRDLC